MYKVAGKITLTF